MTGTVSSAALAWLLTYAIHSSILLSLAWLLSRARRWSPAASELLWKSAMLGAILTATVQLQLDLRPTGTLMLQAPIVSTVSTPSAPTARTKTPSSDTRTDIAAPPSVSAETASPATSISKSTAILLVWSLVAMILGLSYAARRLILVGRLGDRHEVDDERLLEMLSGLAQDAGLRSTPILTSTSRISSPVALGIREICVPDTVLTDLDVEQQRSLLAHELAHIARRDPVWLVLGSFIERVFWIQPLNRVANREIARSTEFLCDDWAVGRTGSGVPLARCLAQVAEWIQAAPLGVPLAGMAEERSLLVTRVDRLVKGINPSRRSRRGVATGAVAVLAATILVVPGVSGKTRSVLLAGEPPKSAPLVPTGIGTAIPSMRTESRPQVVAVRDTGEDAGVVTALIARLADEDADVRSAAAHSLGRLKDSRAVPGLIGILHDPEMKVRAAGAESLSEFEDPRAIVPLTTLLDDQSSDVKENALDALSHYDRGLPTAAFVRLLSDPDADVRQKAAELVGKSRDRSTTGALAKLIGDSSPDVRRAAIEAIGELGDPSGAVAVIPALSDANSDVREQALGTIDDLKAAIAEGTLIALLRDRDADVREKAARMAGDRSIVAAIPTLRRMLDDPNSDVRESAVSALGDIADASAYDALRSALTSKDAKVRQRAAEALGDRSQ